MNMEGFMDYAVVTVVVAVCAFLILRSIKRTVTGGASMGACSCCPENKDCGK
jgi:hypothetical protein